MSRMKMAVLMAVAVLAFAAAPAFAMTWGGEVFGAFNTYSMGDFNDGIKDLNTTFGTNYDEIGTGFGGGLGLRFWPNSTWMLEASWEPLFPSTKDDASNTEFNLNANSFQATAGYFFPTNGMAKYGLGAGLGYYTISGEVKGFGSPIDGDLSGSTVGFHFMGMGEWTVSPGFAVTAAAGYRIANVSDTKLQDISSDPKAETDYSGMMLRAGLAFYMPSAGK